MSTNFRPAQCPTCKGMLQVPTDRDTCELYVLQRNNHN
jgi:hypothetical protein